MRGPHREPCTRTANLEPRTELEHEPRTEKSEARTVVPFTHDPAFRAHQVVRRPRPARPRHVADYGARACRAVRPQRRRQDHAAPDDGRPGRARLGRHPQAGGADRRLPAAGWPHPRRPHGVRRGEQRVRRLARDEDRDARARGAAGRPGDSRARARRDARAVQRPAGSLPAGRRLQIELRDRHRAPGSWIQDERLRAADRDLLRRLADAHRAREAAARPAEPAAARRADQPSRPRGAQLARRLPERLSARGDPRLARPVLPRRGGHAHRRSHAADADRLRRQLQPVSRRARSAHRSAAQGEARAGRGSRARQDVHRPVPLPGDQGVAGPEPDQDAREGRADRGAARAEEDPLRLSRPPARAAGRCSS